jgi:hypothetical protein
MKAIEADAAKAWCEGHRFQLNEHGLPAWREWGGLEDFAIPPDAGARVALVREHMSALKKEEELCIWLDDWDVWQSGQRWHIFERFLASYNIGDAIAAKPAYLVQKGDFDVALSIVTFAVLMLADCHVLGSSGRSYLFYSHDEVGHKRA